MSSSSNCATHRRKLLAAALLWPLLPAGALASEPANRPPPALPGIVWRRRGSGVLRRYGFRVYRATLWQGGDETPPALQPPYALALDYALNLRGEDLARVSGEEMRRLAVRVQRRLIAPQLHHVDEPRLKHVIAEREIKTAFLAA